MDFHALVSLQQLNLCLHAELKSDICNRVIGEKLNNIEREVEELLVIKQGLDAEIKIYKTLIDSGESDPCEETSEGMESRECYCPH